MSQGSNRPTCVLLLFAALSQLMIGSVAEAAAPILPENSVGYVRVNFDQISASPSLGWLQALKAEVTDEIGKFSDARLGLDFNDLQAITVILPDFDGLQKSLGGQRPRFIVALELRQPFAPSNIANRLPSGWGTATASGVTFFSNGDSQAIAPILNNLVLLGSDQTVRSCLESTNVIRSATSAFDNLQEEGAISAFLQLESLPEQFRQLLPAGFQSFATAQALSFQISFATGVALDLEVLFAGENDAQSSTAAFQAWLDELRNSMGNQVQELAAGLDDQDASPQRGAAQLLQLAVARSGMKHVEAASVKQSGRLVRVRSQTDTPVSELMAWAYLARFASGL